MSNLPALFSDLALILVTAGVTTVLFKWLKQPLVLGYIIAGFLIGPNFSYFPVLTDRNSVEIWSEIGMVFLLFAIGLEFSFKKLKRVGGSVGITVLTIFITMMVSGFFVGKLIGWTKMDSIFLGCMLAMSSTTIIAKAFYDLKINKERFTEGVIGVLVVEDLVAVLLIVILSTLSVSATFDGRELLYSILKLGFFLLVWFIGGIFIIPSLLKRVRKLMNEETLVVFSVGLCFMMVVLSNLAGFSSALGAFIMGSILAETLEADVIHKLTTPVKNLFGAVFFVSVGMMINPDIIVQYWWQILLLTVVVVVLQSSSSTFGMLLSGASLKDAIRSGMCFAQIGEFSFIIATVGMSFGVIDEFLYPIIVSVSVITTFITPYSIKAGLPLYQSVMRIIPERWKSGLSNQSSGLKVKSGKKVSMGAFLVRQFKNMVIYAAIIIAVMLLSFSLCSLVMKYVSMPWGNAISAAITLVLMSPFLWAMAFKHRKVHTTRKLMSANKFNQTLISLVFLFRFVVILIFSYYALRQFFNSGFWSHIGVKHGGAWINMGFAVVYFFIIRGLTPIMRMYERMEKRFIDNMNKRQSQHAFIVPEILRENFALEKMEVSVASPYAGIRIEESDFRDNYNISVVSVERGDKVVDLPGKDFVLFPNDIITFVGSEAHLSQLKSRVVIEDDVLIKERVESDVDIHKIELQAGSFLVGVKLSNSGLRDRFNAMVIAIERDGSFILNPSASIVFLKGDLVWFVAGSKMAAALIGMADPPQKMKQF